MSKLIDKFLTGFFGNRCLDNELYHYFSYTDFNGLKCLSYEFKSNNNQTLRGNFFYYDNPKNELVIFVHGMFGGYNSYMKEIEYIARYTHKYVLAYDVTGTNSSDGENLIGFHQAVIDLDYCIKSLKSHSFMSLSLVGHSWGAFACGSVLALNDNIKNCVLISAPISFKAMVNTYIPWYMPFHRSEALEIEERTFKDYANLSVLEGLKNTKANVLVIHSIDDKVILYKNNFLVLKNKINKYNISFLTVTDKGHNPNYKKEAVWYMNKVFSTFNSEFKDASKEEQKAYFENVDWDKMTLQDDAVMEYVINRLR